MTNFRASLKLFPVVLIPIAAFLFLSNGVLRMYRPPLVHAQPTYCNAVPFTLFASGAGGVINNTNNQCNFWNASYYSEGFSVVSVAIQGAPDNGGTPGAWANMPSSCVVTGSNPMTSTSAANVVMQGCSTLGYACPPPSLVRLYHPAELWQRRHHG